MSLRIATFVVFNNMTSGYNAGSPKKQHHAGEGSGGEERERGIDLFVEESGVLDREWAVLAAVSTPAVFSACP